MGGGYKVVIYVLFFYDGFLFVVMDFRIVVFEGLEDWVLV